MSDSIRAAVLAALGRSPNAATLRAVATELRGLADELERRAEADARVGHKIRRARIEQEQPGPKGGGRRGTGARFVRVDPPLYGGTSWKIYVGKALWQDLGEPTRISLQRLGEEVRLKPVAADTPHSYALTKAKRGMPHMGVGLDTIETLGLEAGRYSTEIDAGEIVLGELLPKDFNPRRRPS